jgi:GAF domain-containing protein
MEDNADGVSIVEQLQRLILTSSTLDIFLEGFASHIVTIFEEHVDVVCGVTLKRKKQAVTVASSSLEAKALDEVQYGYGNGPCLHALDTCTTTVVQDTRIDGRWPEYLDAIAAQGFHSVLGVPLLTGEDGGVVVNLYAHEPNAFTPEIVDRVEAYAAEVTLTLQLALRLAAQDRIAAHLKAAMESRTNIDIAIGIIIAQNRCTPGAAIDILQRASNGQNIKLRVLAEQLVASMASAPAQTHFTD